MGFTEVERAFESATASGVFPGAVLLVNKDGNVVYHRAFGSRSLEPERTPLNEDTIYDVSSLTKPLATTTAFLMLVRERKILITDRVTRMFHNFGVHGKTGVTFRHLLTHTSGLPAWKPYYKDVLKTEKGGRVNFLCSRGAKEFVYDLVHREKPDGEAGKQAVYSDLNFILLGEAIENATGVTLDRFGHDTIFKPLGLRSTSFVDISLLRTRRFVPVAEMIAPTERCPWRNKILCGEVSDENAYAMGGVAGHAGLFSSARDLDVLVSKLRDCYLGKDSFLPQALMQEVFTRDRSVARTTRALGWDTPSPEGSQSGTRFSSHTVGHLGFTGTSVWLDLEKNVHVILLTNRVHPTRENERIKDFRPRVHDLVMEAVAG